MSTGYLGQSDYSNTPAHGISEYIAYAQKSPIDTHADQSSRIRDLNLCTSLYLYSNVVYASSEGSGEYAHMRRLTRAFVARQCGKY